MFDTHTHLNFPGEFADIESAIGRAHSAGVSHILVPSTDIESSRKAIEIAQMDQYIYAAVGIHPSDVSQCTEDTINVLETLATSSEKVVAIGEIGLDYYWIFKTIGGDKAQKPARDLAFAVQREYFVAQLDLAKRLSKAVIIHCRQAKKKVMEVIDEHWDESFRNRMVFHCCEPEMDLLKYAQKHGIFIGIDGDITYNPAKQEYIKQVPMDMLVLETDAPFLTPDPIRQTNKFPNEPANLVHIARAVAEITHIPLGDVVMQTTRNAQRLFNIS